MSCDRRDIAACGGLLLATLALAPGVVVAGQTFYYGDLTLQFVPWRLAARESLLAGRLPLWSPDLCLGLPLLANCQSATLYPFHWLTLPLSPALTIACGLLLHVWLAAGGGYVFARSLQRSRPAALIAGLAYGLGGYVLSKQQFPSLAYTIAWLPWLAWSAERVWRAPRPGAGGVVALIVAVQWLAGHAQMAVLQLALVAAWLISRGGGPGAGRRWAVWLAAVGLGTGLALGQLLPTLEMLGWSARPGFEFADVARFNFPPWQLGTLLLPQLFGAPQRFAYLGDGMPWETAAWVGLPTLVLALAAARRERVWVALGLVGLVLAFGRYTPLYRLAWEAIPLLGLFRDPARFLLYPVFAASVLAARGYDEAGESARRLAGWLLGLLVVSLLAALLLPLAPWRAALAWVLAQSPTKTVGDPVLVAAGWQAAVTGQLLVASLVAAGLVWLLAGPTRRRWLPVLVAGELLSWGSGLNPTVERQLLAADPRPPEVAGARLIYVPTSVLREQAVACFNAAVYRSPACVAEVRRQLVPNVTMGLGLRTVTGYEPLRTEVIDRWLKDLAELPEERLVAELARVGCDRRWTPGGWRPVAAAAVEPVRLTPQRLLLTGSGEVHCNDAALPGWRAVGATRRPAPQPGLSAWEVTRSPARLVYDPLSVRLGLFLALLAGLLLTAWMVGCHKLFRRNRSQSARRVW